MDIIKKNLIKKQNNKPTESISQNYDYRQKYYHSHEQAKPDNTSNKNSSKNIIFIVSSGVALGFLIIGIFFFWKIHVANNKINSSTNSKSIKPIDTLKSIAGLATKKHQLLRGEREGRINILLLGIAGEDKPGQNLTDTIMIASLDTEKNKVSLLSLPRDLYVEIPNTTDCKKINALYQYGIDRNINIVPLQKSIENITGLNIHYYLIANFDGFEKFIDSIGGISVMVEKDIYDTRYPGPNYTYETFAISKGLHILDGSTALKYARERYDDSEGDFGRAKRQQKVLQATKNKVFSIRTLLNPFALNELLETLGNNIKTNITFDEIDSFIALSKKLDTQNINNSVVDAWKKNSLLKVSHVFYGHTKAFILIPRLGPNNYTEIQELAENIFNLNKIKRRQKDIQTENAKIGIINNSNQAGLEQKVKKLLQDKLNFAIVETLITKNNSNHSKTTTIIDFTDGKKPFSLDELIKKIPAIPSNNKNVIMSQGFSNANNYDFVVLLGDDIREIYNYEEDSPKDLLKDTESSS